MNLLNILQSVPTMIAGLVILGGCLSTGSDGPSLATAEHRYLAESSAPSLSPVSSLSPSLTLAPSLPPSHYPSSSPSAAPSLSAAPSTPAPTFPPVEMDAFEWDLEPTGNGTFQFSEQFDTEEIMLNYNISLRDFAVQLFETDCVTPIPSTIATARGTTTRSSWRHTNLTVGIDIAQDNVTSYSGVWSDVAIGEGLISMCVRVDLMRDVGGVATSVNFHEQRLRVTVGLLQGFQVEFVDVSRVPPSEENEDVDADYEMIACQCNEDFECLTSVLTPGSSVFLCVMSVADNVKIVGIQALAFSQGSMSVRSVFNGTKSFLTSVTIIDKKALIRHQMQSFFFDKFNPDNVIAEGFALIGFTSERRGLLRANFKNRVLETSPEADEMPFSIPLAVESSLGPGSGATQRGLISVMTIVFGAAVLLA